MNKFMGSLMIYLMLENANCGYIKKGYMVAYEKTAYKKLSFDQRHV